MVFKLLDAPLEGKSAFGIENPSAQSYPAEKHPRKSHQTNPFGRPKPVLEESENEDQLEREILTFGNPIDDMDTQENQGSKKKEKPKPKRVIKMEPPPLVQASKNYSITEDLLNTKANVTFAQLLQSPQYRKELKKSITPRRKGTKQVHFGKSVVIPQNATFTPLLCKAQVYGWTIDLIVDSGSSISVISEKFMKDIDHKPTRTSSRTVSDIHGERKCPLVLWTISRLKLRE